MNTSGTGDSRPRQLRIHDAFVELADTLVGDFDPPEFLSRLTLHCVNLLQIVGAGVMLALPDGRLRLLASSSEKVRLLELFELNGALGPCLAAYHSGVTVAHLDLAAADLRWPAFAARAHHDGLRSVHAIPMRLRERTIGVLNLFGATVGPLSDPDQQLGQALTDAATIGLRRHHLINLIKRSRLPRQLQGAFTSRTDIERVKDLLAERHGINPSEAFQHLRIHARNTNRRLADLAYDLLSGRATLPDGDWSQRPGGTAGYVRLATESARAAARDAVLSLQAAGQARQTADAARQRLVRRRPPGRNPHESA